MKSGIKSLTHFHSFNDTTVEVVEIGKKFNLMLYISYNYASIPESKLIRVSKSAPGTYGLENEMLFHHDICVTTKLVSVGVDENKETLLPVGMTYIRIVCLPSEW